MQKKGATAYYNIGNTAMVLEAGYTYILSQLFFNLFHRCSITNNDLHS
jgi:hypothetical protein